ncbi:hypothetical protein Scani_30380 [Streptomyces caniferus]|uniref:Uncharacterized protein n=1 Tax=Streptomyces caniferus TaxID=285557 RepID=A0A640S6F2_9ACTN|nr:hypothetical protein Scani_30380 [Streptomyces caniferus]
MRLDDLPGGDVAAAQPGGEVEGVELMERVGHEDLGRFQSGEYRGRGTRGPLRGCPIRSGGTA